MAEDACAERLLYGGAISMTLPVRFQDLSNVREVPDHQEAFADPSRDESLIIELLDLKQDVADGASALWFLQDLGREQDAEGEMAISKGRQGREAQNLVKVRDLLFQLMSFLLQLSVHLANLRLKEVGTDVLVTAYEPIVINPLSESAGTVGAGLVAPAEQSGHMPMAEVFKLSVSSFKVNDWSLFNA
ncbi:putative ran guanine nucleotide release factor [Bienertia sinuspersici]